MGLQLVGGLQLVDAQSRAAPNTSPSSTDTSPNLNKTLHPAPGGASLFRTPSATFLAPPGSGLAAAEATPDIGIASGHLQLLRAGSGAFEAQLMRAGSCGEHPLLGAAAGFQPFPGAAAFPGQVRGTCGCMRRVS